MLFSHNIQSINTFLKCLYVLFTQAYPIPKSWIFLIFFYKCLNTAWQKWRPIRALDSFFPLVALATTFLSWSHEHIIWSQLLLLFFFWYNIWLINACFLTFIIVYSYMVTKVFNIQPVLFHQYYLWFKFCDKNWQEAFQNENKKKSKTKLAVADRTCMISLQEYQHVHLLWFKKRSFTLVWKPNPSVALRPLRAPSCSCWRGEWKHNGRALLPLCIRTASVLCETGVNQALLKSSRWKRLSSRDEWNLSPATMCCGCYMKQRLWSSADHALAKVRPRQIFTHTLSKNGRSLEPCLMFQTLNTVQSLYICNKSSLKELLRIILITNNWEIADSNLNE